MRVVVANMLTIAASMGYNFVADRSLSHKVDVKSEREVSDAKAIKKD
jgi:hypothetical protein